MFVFRSGENTNNVSFLKPSSYEAEQKDYLLQNFPAKFPKGPQQAFSICGHCPLTIYFFPDSPWKPKIYVILFIFEKEIGTG